MTFEHTSAITASSSELRRASTARGNDFNGIRGVDDQSSGQQTIRQKTADAMDAARGPSFAADKDEGPQRGSGRPIPPLVSKIQVATTNAGARAEGGLTPDFLALSYLVLAVAVFENDPARVPALKLAIDACNKYRDASNLAPVRATN